MDSKMIDRINTLHHKAQSVGLTEEEKIEQAKLRKEYIATIKMNLRNQLDNIDIKEADGTIVNLGEKYGRKKDSLENRFLQPGSSAPMSRWKNGAAS